MTITLIATLAAWASVEVSLVLRDVIRGKGGTARDRGTRSTLVIGWLAAFLGATWIAAPEPGRTAGTCSPDCC